MFLYLIYFYKFGGIAMGAKRAFCTVFYVLFSLLFTAVLICNITGIIHHFGMVPNDLITTKINTNLLTPIHTAIDSLGIFDSVVALNIVYAFMTIMSLAFWILSVSNLANVLRNSSTRGTSLAKIILSIVMFAIFVLSFVLLVRNGETIQNILTNYYFVGQLVVYLLALLVGIFAMSISPIDEAPEEPTEQSPQEEQMTAQQKENRIKQILDDEVDPRV